jgi:integrase
MKAVVGKKYLYLRKQRFYFRIKLPKRLGTREIRIGLQTQDLISAIKRINQFKPHIQQLKQLVITSKSLDTSDVKPMLMKIKDAMLKQLSVRDIDVLIAELEQGYSNGAHALNVLGQTELLSNDNHFKEQLTYIALAPSNETRTKRLKEVIAGLSEEDKWPFMEALSSMVKVLVNHSDEIDELGNHELARQLLLSKGYEADTSSLAFKMLVSKLITSANVKHDLLQAVFEGNATTERQLQQLLSSNTTSTVLPSKPESPVSSKPLFSNVYTEFLDHKIKKDKLSDKMQKSYERLHIVWQAIAQDKPIDTYTPQDIGRFIDRCFELPRMNITPYNKMTWEQRLDVDVPDEDLQSPKSVEQYYKWVMGVFSYAKKDTIAYITNSPCSIKRNFKARTRGIFSDNELVRLLNSADKEKTLWKKWIIRLSIYTGARRGELVQLRKSDVKYDENTKRYYLLITDEHESQNLKTVNSKRKIPVHNVLVEAGFIDYVKSCKDRVFDALTNVEVVTGWMPRHMASLGIPPTNELDHIRSFHSIRHTFITKSMSEPDVNINLLQQIVGHEISSFGITSNYTHRVTEIKNLIPIIDAFEV